MDRLQRSAGLLVHID